MFEALNSHARRAWKRACGGMSNFYPIMIGAHDS
jgi:hypothetical protein